MKIAFVIPGLGIGGVETVFINLLSALQQYSDAELYVFTHREIIEPVYKDFFDRNKNIKLHVYYPKADFFERLQKYCHVSPLKQIRKFIFHIYKFYKNKKVGRQITKMHFDAVVDYVTCSAYKQLLYIKNVRKITFLHGCFRCLPNSVTKYFHLYDNIIVLTDNALTDARQKHPKHNKKFIRIYNIVDTKHVQQILKTKISNIGKFFLSVSRLDFDKDIATIIRAFDIFYQSNNRPDCKLVIIGDGNNKKNLEQFAKQFESNANILFLGKIPEPYNYMHNAIAHILSSKNEAFGSVLIETAASGTLNIAANCFDGPREILMDGKNGLLFTPGDEKKLAKIISDVYNGRIDVKSMVNNMAKSLNRFESKTIAEQFINLIKNTIKE